MPMRFSFIIPAYNEEKYIGDCLKAIFAADSFSEDCEVIVVNNASTDGTVALVQRYFPKVKIVDEPRKGLAFARQRGLIAARGEYICNIDADNCVLPDWLMRVRAITQQMPVSCVAISGPYKLSIWSKYMQGLYEWSAYILNSIFNRLRLQGMLFGGNMVIRREALERVGGYDTSFLFWGEDSMTAKRLAKIGTIHFSRQVAVVSSPRRFQNTGSIKLGILYIINGIWIGLFSRPFSKKFKDFR